jgi:hypothetical protein
VTNTPFKDEVAIQISLFGGNPVEVKRAVAKRRLAGIHLSEPLANPTLRALSLGLGLQSVTLAFMSARGDLPMLDAAIFADTGHEKRATYEYLDYLRTNVPFPIAVVRRPGASLGEHAIANVALPKDGRHQLPLHTVDSDGTVGMLPKQCNSDWKKRVVHREIIRMLHEAGWSSRVLPREPVIEEWLGMTLDELNRLGPSERPFIHHRYPLVEDNLRYKRPNCTTWLLDRGYRIPPRSACIFCPFQRNDEWRDMRDNHPDDFSDAIDFDAAIRVPYVGFDGSAYLHRDRVALVDADLSTPEDHGQESVFGCGDGICGT